jgi:hypothetical protein
MTVDLRITVADGRVQPPPGRVPVPVGSTVRLTVRSDRADDVHVHGYDLTEPLAAGRTATLDFVADQTGLFDVELHRADTVIVSLLVS